MSSEALERAKQTVREALEQGVLSHQCGVDSIAAFGALLAEVARLEQAVSDVTRDRATDGLRLHRAEAALAVAREREQRYREALGYVIAQERYWLVEERARKMADIARAALVDEPAAASEAISRPNEWTAHNIPEFEYREPPAAASAAADEPGETPTSSAWSAGSDFGRGGVSPSGKERGE